MAKRLQDAAIVNTIVPIEKIAPHTANYNIHGDTQLSQLDASHDAFGQYRSTVVWAQADGTYIQVAGHGIVEAMRHKGVKEVRADVLPVETDEATIRAILVADNLHAQNAEPDNDALARLLQEQQEAGFALDALGMTDAQLDELLAALDVEEDEPEDDGGDEFDTTPQDGPTRTHTGELWQLGKHRLYVGDSTNAEDVARLLGSSISVLLMTSPPYWVGKSYEREQSWAEIQTFIRAVAALCASHVHPQGRIILNTGTVPAGRFFHGTAQVRLLLDDWQTAFAQAGWVMRYVRCWAKRGQLPLIAPSMDVIDTHWEMIGYFYYPPAKPFIGQQRVGEPWATDGIWDDIPGERSADGTHEAAFPLEIPRRNILLFSEKGDIVWDAFLGSGTTLIACEREGRICYGMEIEPRYADVILKRFTAETGVEPTLLDRRAVTQGNGDRP